MSTPSRLAGLRLVDPHRTSSREAPWCHTRITAHGDEELVSSPRALEAVIAGAGRERGLEDWLHETFSTSLVVVDHGTVVLEWYADGVGATSLFLGASMSKSALAHLVGLAVTEGSLGVDDQVVAHVPELTGTGYEGCTVEHLLTMTTGVDWVEDHRDPDSLASRLLGCFAASTGDSRELLGSVRPRSLPGTRFEYSTADSQVLDWVRERATGGTYAEALEDLWTTLGCTADAVVATDAPDGVALAGGGLAATARDWVRLAMLEVDGTCDAHRVLAPTWVDRSAAPSRSFLAPGRLPSSITTHAGFGYHWWPLDDAGRRVTADGSRGQFGYVDRDQGVVVGKTSQWPYDDWLSDRQHRDLSYLGLPEVARAAVGSRDSSGRHRP